jgi:hypothetical protein
MRKQQEEATGDRQILLEVQELVAISEFSVKQNGGGDTEGREEERGSPGVIAAQDENAAAQFERNRERQQLPGHPEGLHVGKRRRIARELAPGLVQEERRKQEAARKRGRRHYR